MTLLERAKEEFDAGSVERAKALALIAQADYLRQILDHLETGAIAVVQEEGEREEASQ